MRKTALTSEKKILTGEQKAAVKMLQQEFGLAPMNDPYEYVKSIQENFDGSKIQYSDEYYDVTGIENQKEMPAPDKPLLEFEAVTLAVRKKNDK